MAFAVACGVAGWLLLAVIVVGRHIPGYRHVRDPISALAQVGSPFERSVSYGVFLPIGVGTLGLGGALLGHCPAGGLARCAALLSAGIGVGYVASALAHWDPAAPLSGSPSRLRKARIHFIGAIVEYGGGVISLTAATALLELPWALATAFAALVVAVSAIAVERSSLAPFRGVIQRGSETLLFGALLGLVYCAA